MDAETKRLANETLEGFHLGYTSLLDTIKDKEGTPPQFKRMRRAVEGADKARIFSVPASIRNKFSASADKLIFGNTNEIEDAAIYMDTQLAERRKKEIGKFLVPPWDLLPFDSIYIGFGFDIKLTHDEMNLRMGATDYAEFLKVSDDLRLLGYLIHKDASIGSVHSFVGVIPFNKTKPTTALTLNELYDPKEGNSLSKEGWYDPYTLDPWVIHALIHYLNEFKSTTIETSWTDGQRYQRSKRPDLRHLPIPKPYYIIELKDEVVQKVSEDTFRFMKPRHELNYRFDVRGHECCRVMHGAEPLSPALRSKLLARKYTIYLAGEKLQDHHRQLLDKRFSGRKPGEWIAVLTYWQSAHIKGPKDKPYIPAIRVAG